MVIPLTPLRKTGAFWYRPAEVVDLLRAFDSAGGTVDAEVWQALRALAPERFTDPA
jgi:hypothetical protein